MTGRSVVVCGHTKLGDGLKCYKGIILSWGCGFEVLQKNHTKWGGGGGVEVLQKNHTKFEGG